MKSYPLGRPPAIRVRRGSKYDPIAINMRKNEDALKSGECVIVDVRDKDYDLEPKPLQNSINSCLHRIYTPPRGWKITVRKVKNKIYCGITPVIHDVED